MRTGEDKSNEQASRTEDLVKSPKPVTPANPGSESGAGTGVYNPSKRLDSPSTAGCENWPLQPAAQGGEPVENPELVEVVEPRLLSSFGGLAGMTRMMSTRLFTKLSNLIKKIDVGLCRRLVQLYVSAVYDPVYKDIETETECRVPENIIEDSVPKGRRFRLLLFKFPFLF